ncbi:MAG: (2E,6E)-farnesyl diphosphate synthase [Gammaproteobacteria bacterium]|nr:(2E,6E)-farnesyl diphosphate synthase [Gammaproteobacteria bacterium]MDH5728157.1 (2E,6E)-farnesyl diphosphate synthase [Gammaproteobacteria bacterium]
MSNPDFQQMLELYQERVETALNNCLPAADLAPTKLHQAMRYSVMGGGKRVRPVLVYGAGQACGASLDQLDAAACAVEIVHVYSLIHDDLPAMDNDDLRRGKATCHIAFDEATAILAGDALQALAFDLLADQTNLIPNDSIRVKMIDTLARASGSMGMAGGQAIDLESVGKNLDLQSLKTMHEKKTGALIKASIILGAYTAGGQNPAILKALEAYGQCIGLAFQVRDDILDVESDTETLGKQQGADMALDKPTYVALLGLDGAKKVALDLHQQAVEHLQLLDQRADFLRKLSAYIVKRSY